MSVVYFIECGEGGPVKIGVTKGLKSRVAHMQNGSPYPLIVKATLPGSYQLESLFHRALAAHRLSGEWFARSEEVNRTVEAAASGIVALPKRHHPPALSRDAFLAAIAEGLADQTAASSGLRNGTFLSVRNGKSGMMLDTALRAAATTRGAFLRPLMALIGLRLVPLETRVTALVRKIAGDGNPTVSELDEFQAHMDRIRSVALMDVAA